MQTLTEQQENQMKRFNKEQTDIAKMKEYVARFGHGSRKLAKQGKSKEKLLNKRLAEGMTEAVFREKTVSFESKRFQLMSSFNLLHNMGSIGSHNTCTCLWALLVIIFYQKPWNYEPRNTRAFHSLHYILPKDKVPLMGMILSE